MDVLVFIGLRSPYRTQALIAVWDIRVAMSKVCAVPMVIASDIPVACKRQRCSLVNIVLRRAVAVWLSLSFGTLHPRTDSKVVDWRSFVQRHASRTPALAVI